MPLQLIGNSGVVAEVSPGRAFRVENRPLDVGALGSYALAMTTGTMAAGLAATAPIFSFRWANATNNAIIRKVVVSMGSLVTGFAAGIGIFRLMPARSFSASDSGGTPATLTGNNMKRRTSFGTTLAADIRIASTATLTAGTRTLDANEVAAIQFTVTATAQTVHLPPSQGVLWTPDQAAEWPLVLAQNEGFIIQATVPATGTWQGQVNIEWAEIAAANF